MRWVLILIGLAAFGNGLANDPVRVSEVAPDSALSALVITEIDYQLIRAERLIWIEYYGLLDRIALARHSSSNNITEPSLDNYPAFLISLRYDRLTDRIIVFTDLLPFSPYRHFFEEMKWERKEHVEEVGRYR
jgi:hypothetical protein